jgi:SUN domain-containing protein 1/2
MRRPRRVELTVSQYLSHLRQKAWIEPLKWFGIVGGLLGILWWLVNHAPPTDISGIERERTSHVGYLPRQTGVEDGNQGMDDLLRRLSDLETTLAILSGETEASRDERQRSQTALDSAHIKMKQLDDDLRTQRSKRDQDRRDLDQLRTTVQTVRQQVEVSSSLASSVEELGRKVETLESDMREALSEQRMMRLLERVLPSGVPVRREKTGEVTIDPSFWTELRKVMATKAEVDSLSNKVSVMKKGTEKPASSFNVPTWKDFLDENEETLRVWAERTFDRKMVDAQVVDRFSFMSMLRDELASLQTTMREEAVARESSTRARIDRQLGEAPVITGDVDTDIKPVIQRLIDDSLLKYSKDTLAKPDYALASGGAQIVHDQTTTAMDLVREKTAWSWLSGARQIGLTTTGRMPEVVLHPNTLPGMCWPFDGARGEVGVHLSREVRVTDVTVEHAARELVSAKSLASAPRDMELVSRSTVWLGTF